MVWTWRGYERKTVEYLSKERPDFRRQVLRSAWGQTESKIRFGSGPGRPKLSDGSAAFFDSIFDLEPGHRPKPSNRTEIRFAKPLYFCNDVSVWFAPAFIIEVKNFWLDKGWGSPYVYRNVVAKTICCWWTCGFPWWRGQTFHSVFLETLAALVTLLYNNLPLYFLTKRIIHEFPFNHIL